MVSNHRFQREGR
jgi:hypothetical protein